MASYKFNLSRRKQFTRSTRNQRKDGGMMKKILWHFWVFFNFMVIWEILNGLIKYSFGFRILEITFK